MKGGKGKKKKQGKYAAAEKHQAVKKRLFTKNLPLCQHAIYSIAVLLNNKKAEWYFLEQKYLRVLTYLIDQFYQAGEPFIMPISVKRRYHAHQLRDALPHLRQLGLEVLHSHAIGPGQLAGAIRPRCGVARFVRSRRCGRHAR